MNISPDIYSTFWTCHFLHQIYTKSAQNLTRGGYDDHLTSIPAPTCVDNVALAAATRFTSTAGKESSRSKSGSEFDVLLFTGQKWTVLGGGCNAFHVKADQQLSHSKSCSEYRVLFFTGQKWTVLGNLK